MVERFEDFAAWQKARMLTSNIYKVTAGGGFARDFGLRRSDTKGVCVHHVQYSRGI